METNKTVTLFLVNTKALVTQAFHYQTTLLYISYYSQSVVSVVMFATTKHPAESENLLKQWVILKIMPNQTFKFNFNQNE